MVAQATWETIRVLLNHSTVVWFDIVEDIKCRLIFAVPTGDPPWKSKTIVTSFKATRIAIIVVHKSWSRAIVAVKKVILVVRFATLESHANHIFVNNDIIVRDISIGIIVLAADAVGETPGQCLNQHSIINWLWSTDRPPPSSKVTDNLAPGIWFSLSSFTVQEEIDPLLPLTTLSITPREEF